MEWINLGPGLQLYSRRMTEDSRERIYKGSYKLFSVIFFPEMKNLHLKKYPALIIVTFFFFKGKPYITRR